MSAKGLSYPFLKIYNFVFEGDSLTAGNGLTVPIETWPFQLSAKNAIDKSNGARWANLATSGNKITDMLTQTATVDALYDAGYSENWAVLFAGTNDIPGADSAQTIYNNCSTWISGRKAVGFKTVILTIFGTSQKCHDFNALIRLNSAGAEKIVDLVADSRLADSTNLTYFQVDGHLNATGCGVVADLVRAVLPK